jgi:hypothetical protein
MEGPRRATTPLPAAVLQRCERDAAVSTESSTSSPGDHQHPQSFWSSAVMACGGGVRPRRCQVSPVSVLTCNAPSKVTPTAVPSSAQDNTFSGGAPGGAAQVYAASMDLSRPAPVAARTV